MYKLTQTDIEKFQALYMRCFGVDLSKDEARAKLFLLVLQVQRVYKPIPKEVPSEHD